MNETDDLIVRTALLHLLRAKHFSICDLQNILQITQRVPDKTAYNRLRALHCIDYSDMPPELLRKLPEIIKAALGGIEIDISIAMPKEKPIEHARETGNSKTPGARGLLSIFSKP